MYERSLADLFCIPVCHVCTLIVAVCLLCFIYVLCFITVCSCYRITCFIIYKFLYYPPPVFLLSLVSCLLSLV